MKQAVYIFISFFFVLSITFAQQTSGGDDRVQHKQHLHQYIVLEAFKILQEVAPLEASKIEDHIGDITHGSVPWETKTISSGSFREDEEDIVYGFGGPIASYDPETYVLKQGTCIDQFYYDLQNEMRNDPDFRKGLVSASHFWDPEATDNDLVKTGIFLLFEPCVTTNNFGIKIKPETNAYLKARRLLQPSNGEYSVLDFWWEPGMQFYNEPGNYYFTLPSTHSTSELIISYTSLVDLYNTGRCSLARTPGFIMTLEQRDRYVWDILGRICHLLTDMSVPAHTHKDIHSKNQYIHRSGLFYPYPPGWYELFIINKDVDSYEQWIANAGEGQGGDQSHIYWKAENVIEWCNQQNPLVSPIIFPASALDPLESIMTGMRNLAATFASDEYNGTGGNGKPEVIGDIPNPHSTDMNPTNPQQIAWLQNVRDVTIPHCIRAVAGLLYWFAERIIRPQDFEVKNIGVFSFNDFFYTNTKTEQFQSFPSHQRFPNATPPYITPQKNAGDHMWLRSHHELFDPILGVSKFFSW